MGTISQDKPFQLLFLTWYVLLQFPHRGMQALGIHGHLFVNGGNLSLLSGTGRSIHQVVSEDFTKRWRWTAVSHSNKCSATAVLLNTTSHRLTHMQMYCNIQHTELLYNLSWVQWSTTRVTSAPFMGCLPCSVLTLFRPALFRSVSSDIGMLQGVGVRWQTTIGVLEINLCQVLAHQANDRPKVGLQFGVIPTS